MNNTLVADTLVEPTEPMMIKIPEIPQELQLPLVVAVSMSSFLSTSVHYSPFPFSHACVFVVRFRSA